MPWLENCPKDKSICWNYKRNYWLTRVEDYENLKLKPLTPLQADPDPLVEELKRAYLMCYVWLNALKATFPLLNMEVYEWNLRGDYNEVWMWVWGNQIPPFMANSNETDLKKKCH